MMRALLLCTLLVASFVATTRAYVFGDYYNGGDDEVAVLYCWRLEANVPEGRCIPSSEKGKAGLLAACVNSATLSPIKSTCDIGPTPTAANPPQSCRTFLGECPHGFDLQFVHKDMRALGSSTPAADGIPPEGRLPALIDSGTEYEVWYLFWYNQDIWDIETTRVDDKGKVVAPEVEGTEVHLRHANIHSCLSSQGVCAPSVKKEAGVNVQSVALNAAFDGVSIQAFHAEIGSDVGGPYAQLCNGSLLSDSVRCKLFKSTVLVDNDGAWDVVVHTSFKAPASKGKFSLDICIGTNRDVSAKGLTDNAKQTIAIAIGCIVVIAIVGVVFFRRRQAQRALVANPDYVNLDTRLKGKIKKELFILMLIGVLEMLCVCADVGAIVSLLKVVDCDAKREADGECVVELDRDAESVSFGIVRVLFCLFIVMSLAATMFLFAVRRVQWADALDRRRMIYAPRANLQAVFLYVARLSALIFDRSLSRAQSSLSLTHSALQYLCQPGLNRTLLMCRSAWRERSEPPF
jgi:hypothetical protein